jgi:flagellar hook-associated protein 3 FlgL
MRVTDLSSQTQFLAAVQALQTNVSVTQNQLSSGLAFTDPSQDPVAAGEVNNLNTALSQSQQYQTNANAAQSSLGTEDNTLSQVETQLQNLRDLVLQANSGTNTAQNLSSLASQAVQIQSGLLALANTQDGNGQYIFAGYATQTQPFDQTATGATYAGNQGQQMVQIAAGQTVAVGYSGDAVFNQIKTGNGTFTVTAAAANTGTGVVGATTVADPAAYNGGTYAVTFGAGGTYNVTNAANAVVSTGTYTDGATIAFDGLQVTLSGTPAAGDAFTVAPSTNQSLFTSVQDIVNALQSPTGTATQSTQLGNSLSAGLNNLDQALSQIENVRAGVGGRVDTVTTALSVAGSQQTQLQSSIASLQGVDYATAITNLDSENTALTAALQAYTVTQGLTLFKYL